MNIPAKLTGKGREQRQAQSRATALQIAEDTLELYTKHGSRLGGLAPKEQGTLLAAWRLAKEAGLPDFLSVVEAGIKTLRPEGGVKTVAEVVQRIQESKESRQKRGELDPRTLRDFKSRTKRFCLTFGKRPINTVSLPEIQEWLSELRDEKSLQPLSTRTQLNYHNTLSEVFTNAVAWQHCTTNPFERLAPEDARRLSKGKKAAPSERLLTVEEAKRLLEAATQEPFKDLLPSFILRLFCGVRTEEVTHLEWKHVHWTESEPYLNIPPEIAKKRRIRNIPIPPNAVRWLAWLKPKADGKVVKASSPNYYSKRCTELSRAAGFEETAGGKSVSAWKRNATRCSFASYHLALHSDRRKTEEALGHIRDADMLFNHYRTLTNRGQAEKYFDLLPPGAEGGVVQFPAAAMA